MKKLAVAVGILIGVGALIWVVTALPKFAGRILPGGSIVRSKSMELRDLVFKKEYRGKTAKWHLRVPRAFIYSEIGSNGNTLMNRYFFDGEDNSFIVGFNAIIDQKTNSLSPATHAKSRNDAEGNRFYFNVMNSWTNVGRKMNEICLPNEEYDKKYIEEKYAYLRTKIRCGENGDVYCRHTSYYKGWDLSFSINKKRKDNYLPICQSTLDFLDKYTVSIDNLDEVFGKKVK